MASVTSNPSHLSYAGVVHLITTWNEVNSPDFSAIAQESRTSFPQAMGSNDSQVVVHFRGFALTGFIPMPGEER